MTGDGLVIGVDCSTTGVKAVLVDGEGVVRSDARVPLVLSRPSVGRYEQDPRHWVSATKDAISKALSSRGVDSRRVSAIAIANQREGFVCLDGEYEAVTPGILWLDSRARAQCEQYGSSLLTKLTGRPPDLTPALYKLLWLRENEPELFNRTRLVADVQAVIIFSLADRWITSRASGDSLGLMDIRQGEWSGEVLSLVGLVPNQLPSLQGAGEVVGPLRPKVAKELGLSPETVVVTGAGDGQAAILGAGVLVESNRAVLNLGTAMVCGAPTGAMSAATGVRWLVGAQPGTFVAETLLRTGAFTLQWLQALLGGSKSTFDQHEVIALAAEEPVGPRGVFYVPYLEGAASPYWDPSATACLVGLRGGDGPEVVARAGLEGVAFEQRLHLEALEQAVGLAIEELAVVGGGFKAQKWAQVFADVLGRPLVTRLQSEGSATGAAVMAAAGAGWGGPGSLGERIARLAVRFDRPGRTIFPHEESQEPYRLAYNAYRKLYPALSKLYQTPAMHETISAIE